MKQIFDEKDLIGKTIAAIFNFDDGYSTKIFQFTDDMFTVYEVNHDENADIEIETSPFDSRFTRHYPAYNQVLIILGLRTQAEYDEWENTTGFRDGDGSYQSRLQDINQELCDLTAANGTLRRQLLDVDCDTQKAKAIQSQIEHNAVAQIEVYKRKADLV